MGCRVPGGDPADRRLRPHQPFGRIEGRDTYLEWMQPMTGEGAVRLQIHRVLGGEGDAVVRYEIGSSSGPVQACDWIRVVDGRIAEIHSFYDATDMR